MGRSRALTAGAGALPLLVFPEPSLWWLGPVILVPWLLLLARAPGTREAAVRGWCGGAGFVLAVHHWLAPNVHVFLPVVATVVGLAWLPWGVLVRRLLRSPLTATRLAVAAVGVPSGWVLVEVVRSWERLGGPWALLGTSQADVPPALSLASLGGVWLVSWVLVSLNVAVTGLVLAEGRSGSARATAWPRAVHAASAAVVVTLVAATGLVWRASAPPQVSEVLRVVAVQPGLHPRPGERLAAAEELTRSVPPGSVDLVVWGESSVGFDVGSRPDLRQRLTALSADVGAPLLVNVDARRPDVGGIAKSAVLVDADGVQARYDKTRLVPFGEYVPLRGLLGWLTGPTAAAGEDRRRGEDVTVFTDAPGHLAPLVCFESAFPDMARTLARRGAGLVVVQSATSTFQQSWAPEQHAWLAAVRAAESGRPVLHATLTGETRAFDARGKPIGPVLGTGERGVARFDIPLSSGTTGFVRLGDWVPMLSALVVALVLVAAWAARPGRAARLRHLTRTDAR